MKNKYMQARNTRREFHSESGRFRGGKLAPVQAVMFRESESGVINHSCTVELDAVAGRLITEVNFDVTAVYVPALAIDALKNPEDDYPGNAEIFRQKLLSGAVVFDLENEGEISKRCGITPRSINGVKKVNEAIRLAHNVAVNHLRRQKYIKATQLLANNTAMTPALVARNVLDRLNAVLDPEDRVNGAVNFSGQIAIKSQNAKAAYNGGQSYPTADNFATPPTDADGNYIWTDQIWGELGTGDVNLEDFYQAEKMDKLTRTMREMVDKNPEYGEELVLRFAAGLDVQVDNQPFTIYKQSKVLGRSTRSGMDGPSLDVQQTDLGTQHTFSVPVPATEFGGVVIIFAAIRPDENLASQPHPIASDVWQARNYVADELALDPVPVTVRDLYADCDQADENVVACYMGNNHLQKTYMHYGFSRQLDVLDVEDKTSIWQLEVPMSVTPDSVIYPELLSHYPFNDATAEVVTYTTESTVSVRTPVIFGPAPIEELAVIETSDVFEEDA